MIEFICLIMNLNKNYTQCIRHGKSDVCMHMWIIMILLPIFILMEFFYCSLDSFMQSWSCLIQNKTAVHCIFTCFAFDNVLWLKKIILSFDSHRNRYMRECLTTKRKTDFWGLRFMLCPLSMQVNNSYCLKVNCVMPVTNDNVIKSCHLSHARARTHSV